MGLFGTSNSTIYSQMNANQQAQFKTMNNLLTLQENHVEDFFQYHGELEIILFLGLVQGGQLLPKRDENLFRVEA